MDNLQRLQIILDLSDPNNYHSYDNLIDNINQIYRISLEAIQEDLMDDGEESDG